MRAALTSIAVLIILVLVTALGAPFFAEWANYRPQIEAAFLRLTGIEATFSGPIQLQFLPSPYLHAGGATLRLAGATLASGDFTVEGQWTQLAGGAAHLSALSLTRPTIILPRDGTGDVGGAAKSLSIDVLHLVDGMVKRVAPDGSVRALAEGINFDGTVDLASEPIRGKLRLQAPVVGQVVGQIAVGAATANKAPLKAELTLVDQGAVVTFDGAMVGFSGWLADAAKAPRLLGKAGAAGKNAPFAAMPIWSATSTLDGDAARGVLGDVFVRLGAGDHSVEMGGIAHYDFTDHPTLALALTAKTLDLDKAFAGKAGAVARPQAVLGQAIAALGGLARRPSDALALDLDLKSDTAILGGQSITGARFGWRQIDAASAGVHLSADMPGVGSLFAEGALALNGALIFTGEGKVNLNAPARFSTWYGVDAPIAAWLGNFGDMPVSAGGRVTVSIDALSSKDATLGLGATQLQGSLRWSQAEGGARPTITADLKSAKLDLRSPTETSNIVNAFANADVALALRADALSASREGEPDLHGGGLTLALKTQKDAMVVDNLSIDDFAGASVEAHGAADIGQARWDGKINARDASGLADLVGRMFPSALTGWAASHASAISPVAATFSLRAPSWTAMLAGNEDALNLRALGPGYDLTTERASVVGSRQQKLSVKFSSDDARRALTLLVGERSLPPMGTIKAAFSLDDASVPNSKAALTVDGALGALTWQGQGGFVDGHFLGTGEGHVAAVSAATMADVFGVHLIAKPNPDAAVKADAHVALTADGMRIDALKGALGGATFTGSINWSAPVASAATSSDPTIREAADIVRDAAPAGQVSLHAALAFDVVDMRSLPSLLVPGAHDASLYDGPSFSAKLTAVSARMTDVTTLRGLKATLDVGASGMKISDVTASLGTATIGGDASVSRSAGVFSITGAVSAKKMPLPPPFAQGTTDVEATFATTGQTSAQLVSGISGTGQVTAAGAVLARADPGALRRTVQRMWQLDLSPEQPKVHQLLGAELDKAGLKIADQTVPATINAGTLSLGPFNLAFPDGGGRISGQVDLATGQARVALRAQDDELLKFWRGGPPEFDATFESGKDGVTRTLDIDALVSGLTAQSLERAADRASTFEADIRERAYFIRREKAEKFMARRGVELAAFAAEAAKVARAVEAAKAAAANVNADPVLDPAVGPAANPAASNDPSVVKPKSKSVVITPDLNGLY